MYVSSYTRIEDNEIQKAMVESINNESLPVYRSDCWQVPKGMIIRVDRGRAGQAEFDIQPVQT